MEKAINLLSPLVMVKQLNHLKKKKKKHFRLYFQCFSSLVEFFNLDFYWDEVLWDVVFETTFVIFSGVCMVNPIAR